MTRFNTGTGQDLEVGRMAATLTGIYSAGNQLFPAHLRAYRGATCLERAG